MQPLVTESLRKQKCPVVSRREAWLTLFLSLHFQVVALANHGCLWARPMQKEAKSAVLWVCYATAWHCMSKQFGKCGQPALLASEEARYSLSPPWLVNRMRNKKERKLIGGEKGEKHLVSNQTEPTFFLVVSTLSIKPLSKMEKTFWVAGNRRLCDAQCGLECSCCLISNVFVSKAFSCLFEDSMNRSHPDPWQERVFFLG